MRSANLNSSQLCSVATKTIPVTAPGREFDDAYSMNTIDICPVGALTSSDFRFKARVWEMNQTPSIDISNGKGCNIDLWTRDNLVLRITPRHNAMTLMTTGYLTQGGMHTIYSTKIVSQDRLKSSMMSRYNHPGIMHLTTLAEQIERDR